MYLIQELHLEACGYQGAENRKTITITVALYGSPSVLIKKAAGVGFCCSFAAAFDGFWHVFEVSDGRFYCSLHSSWH